MIECSCGRKVATPLINGAETVQCECGLRYGVSVDVEQVYRLTRELALQFDRLVKLGPIAAMIRAEEDR